MPAPKKPTIKKKVEEKVTVGVPEIKTTKASSTVVKGEVRVGLSKGATISMGNYQSARIDVWLERIVEDNEHSINKALMEISDLLDEAVAEEQGRLGEDW